MDQSGQIWPSKRLYLMMISYSISLRIPRETCPWQLKSGAGILLLIPIQFILMFVVTVPCTFMEMAMGQYSSKMVIRIWDLCPLFRGVGICSCVLFMINQVHTLFVTNSVLLFALFSVGSEAAYKSCNMSWNTINCFTLEENYTRRSACYKQYSVEECDRMKWESSVAQYFERRILHLDENVSAIPDLRQMGFMLITIVIVFLANYHGAASTDLFLMFLLVVPTLQIAMLFLTPLLQSRAYSSLMYLFHENDPSRLTDYNFWLQMTKMVSSDSGLGLGGMIAIGTHRHFRKPILFTSMMISLIVFIFTIIYSLTIEDFMSNLMAEQRLYKDEVLSLEQQLNMPDAIFFLPEASRVWITMWLSHLYMLGLRNLIAMMCITTDIIYNSYPKLRNRHTVVLLLCCAGLMASVSIFTSRIGYDMHKVISRVILEVGLPFTNFCKVMGVAYGYGVTNFQNDIHFMIGIKMSTYAKLFYSTSPILFCAVFIRYIRFYFRKGARDQGKVWLNYFQQAFIWSIISTVVFYWIYYIIRNVIKKNYKFFLPSKNWGPKDPMLKKSREMFTAHNMTKEYMYRQARFGANRF